MLTRFLKTGSRAGKMKTHANENVELKNCFLGVNAAIIYSIYDFGMRLNWLEGSGY